MTSSSKLSPPPFRSDSGLSDLQREVLVMLAHQGLLRAYSTPASASSAIPSIPLTLGAAPVPPSLAPSASGGMISRS